MSENCPTLSVFIRGGVRGVLYKQLVLTFVKLNQPKGNRDFLHKLEIALKETRETKILANSRR